MPSTSPAPVAPASGTPVVEACRADALTVRVDGRSPVRAGEPVAFSVVLTTTQAHCAVDLAADVQLLVTSGSDHIWATGDCPDWHPRGTLDVLKDRESPFEVAWPAQRASGCGLVATPIGAGTYVATANVGPTSGRYVLQVQVA